MILLWGILQDRPLALVRAALARRGAAVFMLDQKDAARAQIQLRVDADVGFTICRRGHRIVMRRVRLKIAV